MVTTYNRPNNCCLLNTYYALPGSVLAVFHSFCSVDRNPVKITALKMRKRRHREITLLENGGSGIQAQLYLSSEPLLFSLTTVLKHYVWSLASFWWQLYCTQVKMFGNGAADNDRWCLVLCMEF